LARFALMVDTEGVLQATSLKGISAADWQEIQSIGNSNLVPASTVATLQYSITVAMALTVDRSGVLNVYRNDSTDGAGWRLAETVGGATLQPGGNVVVFRQSASMVTALTIDRFGVLNRASLDSSVSSSWQGMFTIGGSQLIPGSPIALCISDSAVFTAMVVDSAGMLNVATLDLGAGPDWQGLSTIGGAQLDPGSAVCLI